MNWTNTAKNIYISFSNTLILALILVLSSHILLSLRASYTHRKNYDFELNEQQKIAYSHLSKEQINDLLRATWRVEGGGWEYETWVGFRETPRQSSFVNVNDYGVRSNSKKQVLMAEINDAVWLFGGSSTFGYGVTDSETIPAQLEKNIKKKSLILEEVIIIVLRKTLCYAS